MKRRPAALAILLFTALLLGTAFGSAQQEELPPGVIVPDPAQFEASQPFDDPALEEQVRKLARELRCPTCQALSIEDSPSDISQQMKGLIRERLRAGMTPEEIRQDFVSSYGEWILLSPTPSGFNLLVYYLPLVALLLGLGVIVLGARKWLGAASEGAENDQAAPAP